jgi:diguanylate cyclase (GGDEF)-like protein
MNASPLILACDHRGTGLERELAPLAARGWRIETTTSVRASLARLAGDPPDLIALAPLVRGGSAELRAIDRARRSPQPIPMLVFAEREEWTGAIQAARALEGGEWDLVWHDAPTEEIELRLRRLRNVAGLLDEMGELRHRASHDDRTDLLRPRAFQTRLNEHFSAAERHKFDLALVLIDLDHFGSINKRHDHTVGDILITQVGEVIRRTLRAEDVAGRLGGDEFAVLLPYTRKIDAARVVNRLRDEIRKLSGQPVGSRSTIVISASLGFETFDGSDIESVSSLRQHAERALRAAKVRGGDQGVYFRSLPDAEQESPDDDAPETTERTDLAEENPRHDP